MQAQVRAGLWVLNGEGVQEQVAIYCMPRLVHHAPGFTESLEALDLLALQVAVVTLGTRWLLRRAERAFCLDALLQPRRRGGGGGGSSCVCSGGGCTCGCGSSNGGSTGSAGSSNGGSSGSGGSGSARWYSSPEAVEWGCSKYLVLFEQYLVFLVQLVSLRGLVSDEEPEAALERHLIHKLVLGKHTYSELLRGVHYSVVGLPSFDTVLAKVAVFVPPSIGNMDSGKLALRPHFLAAFDAYYPHYSPAERAKAGASMRGDPAGLATSSPVTARYLSPLRAPFAALQGLLGAPELLAAVQAALLLVLHPITTS